MGCGGFFLLIDMSFFFILKAMQEKQRNDCPRMYDRSNLHRKTCKESVNLVKLTDLKMNSLQYNYRGISMLSEFGGITVYCKC